MGTYILVLLSCVIFILFAIAKTIDINNVTSLKTRGKAIMYGVFSQYKLLVKTAVNLAVMFAAFLVIFLFINMFMTLISGGAGQSLVGVLKSTIINTSYLFFGLFTKAYTNVAHVVLIPIFLLFFMLIFTKGMYKPELYYGTDSEKESGDNEGSAEANRISNTMRHYIIMVVIALFFTASIWILYILLSDTGIGGDKSSMSMGNAIASAQNFFKKSNAAAPQQPNPISNGRQSPKTTNAPANVSIPASQAPQVKANAPANVSTPQAPQVKANAPTNSSHTPQVKANAPANVSTSAPQPPKAPYSGLTL